MAGQDTRIETARLRLRRPTIEDADRIVALVGDPAVSRGLSRVPHPYGRADAEDFLASLEGREDGACPLAVETPGEGLIGLLGFRYEPGLPWAELGYWFGRLYWNRGFATEAVAAALVWAGGSWGRRAVVAGHFADNPASGRVLEKAGFLYTGACEDRLSLARGELARTRMMVWLT